MSAIEKSNMFYGRYMLTGWFLNTVKKKFYISKEWNNIEGSHKNQIYYFEEKDACNEINIEEKHIFVIMKFNCSRKHDRQSNILWLMADTVIWKPVRSYQLKKM